MCVYIVAVGFLHSGKWALQPAHCPAWESLGAPVFSFPEDPPPRGMAVVSQRAASRGDRAQPGESEELVCHITRGSAPMVSFPTELSAGERGGAWGAARVTCGGQDKAGIQPVQVLSQAASLDQIVSTKGSFCRHFRANGMVNISDKAGWGNKGLKIGKMM